MKAAKNFTHGTEDERIVVRAGEEIPKEIVKEVDDSFILEKVAKKNPDSLSRAQLLELAGVSHDGDNEEELNEEEFREGLSEFRTKADLVEWAEGVFGVELDSNDSRSELEDQIVAFQFEEEEESDEEEADEDE